MLGRGNQNGKTADPENRKVERSLQQSEVGTKHSTDSTALYRTLFYCCLILFIAGVIVQLEIHVIRSNCVTTATFTSQPRIWYQDASAYQCDRHAFRVGLFRQL